MLTFEKKTTQSKFSTHEGHKEKVKNQQNHVSIENLLFFSPMVIATGLNFYTNWIEESIHKSEGTLSSRKI